MVAGGNQAAFEIISQRYRDPLYRHCRAILNDHEDASDALQNTLLNAYRALSDKPRDLLLKPWLYRIAHNESISLLRRRRAHAELDEAMDVSSASPGVEERADTNARLRQLIDDLHELTTRQRGALVMREVSGLSYPDIGAALSISENAAKQTVHEAHIALHDLAEGRAMDCDGVRRTLSVGDRRLLKGRKVRSHLRGCGGCRSFQDSITSRRHDLVALAPPIPASLAAALLHSLFGGSAGGGGGIFAGGAGGGTFAGGTGGVAATGVTVTATAAGGGVAAGAGTAAAGAGGLAAAGSAGSGLLAAVSGAAPLLAGAGVIKALGTAAVGLSVGAGAMGLAEPDVLTKVERALSQPPVTAVAPESSGAAPSGLPASVLAQLHGSDLKVPPPVPAMPAAGSTSPSSSLVAGPSGASPSHAAPVASPAPQPPAPATAVLGESLAGDGAAPAIKPDAKSDAPEAKSGADSGKGFELVAPTDAPPASVPDTGAPPATEPVLPPPDVTTTPTMPRFDLTPPPSASGGVLTDPLPAPPADLLGESSIK